MAAGPPLGVTLAHAESFPVGKVDMVRIFPMDFSEFLMANGEDKLCGVILCLQTVLPVVILGVVYAGVAAMRAVMAWKHGGIELKESYVRINRGNIACIREYIRCRDIESVGISSSPFTPYTRRVSLKITTNADFTKVYSLAVDRALAIHRMLILTQTAGSACCPAITEVRIPRLV